MLKVGKTVFLTKSEEYWDKPYPMKRHHIFDVKTVILKGIVTDVKGSQFKARLVDNNGFERDGEEYVFNENCLLTNQNFKDFNSLGVWKKYE